MVRHSDWLPQLMSVLRNENFTNRIIKQDREKNEAGGPSVLSLAETSPCCYLRAFSSSTSPLVLNHQLCLRSMAPHAHLEELLR